MSLDHKDVVRCNDEYVCTACGKSWDVSDREPPECDAVRHQGAPIKLHNLKAQSLEKMPSGGHVYALTGPVFLSREYPDPVRNAEGIDRMHDTAKGKCITVPIHDTPTGRLESNRQAEFLAYATADVKSVSGVSPRFPRPLGDNLPRGCLRSEDFSRLEELALASVNNGWPTPTSPLSAWLVHDLEDPKTSLLVFAMNGPSAVKYIAAITKKPGTLEARRCRSLDEEAFGASPYCDANPSNRNKAEKAARTRVISLLEWLQGV